MFLLNFVHLLTDVYSYSCLCCHQWVFVLFAIRKSICPGVYVCLFICCLHLFYSSFFFIVKLSAVKSHRWQLSVIISFVFDYCFRYQCSILLGFDTMSLFVLFYFAISLLTGLCKLPVQRSKDGLFVVLR